MNRRGLFKLFGASAAAVVLPPIPAPAEPVPLPKPDPRRPVCEVCDDTPGGCDYCVDLSP